MNLDFGIPTTDEQRARWQAAIEASQARTPAFGIPTTGEQRAQCDADVKDREDARIRDIATVAAAQMTAQFFIKPSERPGSNFSEVTRQAFVAALVVYDEMSGRCLPETQAKMARAIADKATEYGISPDDRPLDPRSKSVRRVADMLLEATKVLNRRDTETEK